MKPDQDLTAEAPFEPTADPRPAPAASDGAASSGTPASGLRSASEPPTSAELPATDPYLVTALRAAAAAKAAAARIRAEHPEKVNGVQARPAWVEGRAPPPGLAEPACRQSFTPAAPQAGSAEAAPPARGLSVAEASAASRLAFRPISDKAIRPRFREGYRPLEAEPAGDAAPAPPSASVAGPQQAKSRWSPVGAPGPGRPATGGLDASDTAAASLRDSASEEHSGGDVEAASSTTAEAEGELLLTTPVQPQDETPADGPAELRFTRTVAELERQQVEKQTLDPWGQMIPRPATPRRDGLAPPDEDERPTGLRALWRRLTGR